MHSVIDAFNCCFVFLGRVVSRSCLLNVDICVCVVVQQTRTIPSLQLQELRKRGVRRLPIMYTNARSNNRLTRDPQPPPTKQTVSLSGVACSSYFFSLTVLVGCVFMRNGLLCISVLQFFTRVSFFHRNSLTPCRNEVQTDPYAWSKNS